MTSIEVFLDKRSRIGHISVENDREISGSTGCNIEAIIIPGKRGISWNIVDTHINGEALDTIDGFDKNSFELFWFQFAA